MSDSVTSNESHGYITPNALQREKRNKTEFPVSAVVRGDIILKPIDGVLVMVCLLAK